MNKRYISLFLVLILVVLTLAGCKIQSVEEYHKSQDKYDGIGQSEIDRTDELLAEGKKDTAEVIETEETEDRNKDALDKTNELDQSDKNQTKRWDKKRGTSKGKSQEIKTNNQSANGEPTQTEKGKDQKPATDSSTTSNPKPGADKKKYVSLTIRVDTILNNKDKLNPRLDDEKFVPADGVILKKTKFELKENDTVFDILVRATRKHRIHMEYQGASQNQYGSVYVQGINNVYEFDCGDLSGWMYNVNGNYPNVGCDKYILKDGDNIEWRYTCDLGRDLGVTWLDD